MKPIIIDSFDISKSKITITKSQIRLKISKNDNPGRIVYLIRLSEKIDNFIKDYSYTFRVYINISEGITRKSVSIKSGIYKKDEILNLL